jgi:hypothetical protein
MSLVCACVEAPEIVRNSRKTNNLRYFILASPSLRVVAGVEREQAIFAVRS